jgi:hypothetical protein
MVHIGLIVPQELTTEETLLARKHFSSATDEFLRADYQVRQVLAKMGLFPHDDQLEVLMAHGGGKVSLPLFCRYLQFLKGVHKQPEPKDADTLRAFVALGGNPDRTGVVNAEYLAFACKRFDLTINIEVLVKEVDTSNNGLIDYDEFSAMWRQARGPQAVSGDSDTTSSFWEGALRSAGSGMLEESVVGGGGAGGAAGAGAGGDDSDGADGGEGHGLTLPEAARMVQAGVALSGGSVSGRDEPLPRAQQLRMYLGDCARADEQLQLAAARRASLTSVAANAARGQSFVAGAGRNARSQPDALAGAASVGAGAGGAALGASTAAAASAAFGSVRHGRRAEGASGRLTLPTAASSARGVGGGGRNGSPLGLSSLSPRNPAGASVRFGGHDVAGPNASPAEVLRCAKDIHKQHVAAGMLSDADDTHDSRAKRLAVIRGEIDRWAQASAARPVPGGGTGIKETRNGDITLPEPSVVGGALTEQRKARAGALSPVRTMLLATVLPDGTVTTARSASGARTLGPRGWR